VDACSLPKQPGNCDAYAPSFWHNPTTGVCEPFVYGGCGGNDNRYGSREACLAACPGGGADWGACKLDEDCAATTLSCCEPCEPVDITQLVVVNNAHESDQENLYCAAVGACAPCPSVGELVATRKYFKPVCVSGQCSLIDVRQTQLTDCGNDADCGTRDSLGCGGGCGSTGFVAVNKNANFCDTMDISCPICTGGTPIGLTATCNQGKCSLSALR
jgi:Kunitz/Bovine pancreatic trypsin inhibitor domain